MSNRQFPLSGSTIAYIPILLFAACTPALVQGQLREKIAGVRLRPRADATRLAGSRPSRPMENQLASCPTYLRMTHDTYHHRCETEVHRR